MAAVVHPNSPVPSSLAYIAHLISCIHSFGIQKLRKNEGKNAEKNLKLLCKCDKRIDTLTKHSVCSAEIVLENGIAL